MTNSGALRTSVILSLLCMIVVFNIITVLPQAHETSSSMQLKSIAEVASCLYNRALGGEPREGTAQAAVVRRSRGRAPGSEFDSITVITVTVIITPGWADIALLLSLCSRTNSHSPTHQLVCTCTIVCTFIKSSLNFKNLNNIKVSQQILFNIKLSSFFVTDLSAQIKIKSLIYGQY